MPLPRLLESDGYDVIVNDDHKLRSQFQNVSVWSRSRGGEYFNRKNTLSILRIEI
jgi:hypothetical protein